MILFGLDTEDRFKRNEILSRIRALDLDELKRLRVEINDKIKASGADPTDAVVTLIEQVNQRLRRFTQNADNPAQQPQPIVAQPIQQPQPQALQWEGLTRFAQALEAPGPGDQPHSVHDHLKQRLGYSRLTAFAVKARNGATHQVETITAANFQSLLDAAARHPWAPLNPEQAKLLAGLAKELPLTVAKDRQRDLSAPGLYSKMEVRGGPDGKQTLDPAPYRGEFDKAWQSIVETVDKDVLATVGLPNAYVYMADPDPSIFESRPAYYYGPENSMYFLHRNVSAPRIRHEFGHHIEEQGPVEIWFGLASLLQAVTDGRALDPARDGATREPGYAFDWNNPALGLPYAGYVCSYYADGGTELLSICLEYQVLRDLQEWGDWSKPSENGWPENSSCRPDLAMLLLYALRPYEMGKLGFAVPALL